MGPAGFGIIAVLTAIVSGVGSPNPPSTLLPPQTGGAEIVLRVSGEVFSIPAEQISAVQPVVNEMTGVPQIDLTFDTTAAARFGEITAAHLGQPMDLVVCDQVLMSPVIQEAITGGRIVISGNFTVEETTEIAQRIAGQIPCDASGR